MAINASTLPKESDLVALGVTPVTTTISANGSRRVVISQSNDTAGAVAITWAFVGGAAPATPVADASTAGQLVIGMVNGSAVVLDAPKEERINRISMESSAATKTIWISWL